MTKSTEQIVRDILYQAIKDGLVLENENCPIQCRSAGELCETANILHEHLKGFDPSE